MDTLTLIAVEVLKRYEPSEGYHLAFSGGKDSIVCKKLCDLANVHYKAYYAITTVEPPSIISFIKKFYPDVNFSRSGKGMFSLIRKYGLPTRMTRFCCEHLKEFDGHGKTVITGVRKEESRFRQKRELLELDNRRRYKFKGYVNPIIYWKTKDVYSFLSKYKLPTPDIYTDCHTARGGCIGCPCSHDMRRNLELYPRFKKAYQRAIFHAIQNGKCRPFTDPEDCFNWWISNMSIKNYIASKKQTSLLFTF